MTTVRPRPGTESRAHARAVGPRRGRAGLRGALAAALLAVATLVLSACGANVDTTLTLGAGPTGTREMTVTVSGSDARQYVRGGTAALDASIRAHLPTDLEYYGLKTAADGSISGTFSFSFTSLSDYTAKASAILRAGGSPIRPSITLTHAGNQPGGNFASAAQVKENFTSRDLLAWLVNGLVSDRVVSSANAGYILGGETTATVAFDGQRRTVPEPIDLSQTTDRGFDAVAMTTTLGTASVDRTLTFEVGNTKYAANPSLYDTYFDTATPGGAKLTATSDDTKHTWTLAFGAPDVSTVATMTNQALHSEATLLLVTQTVDPNNPLVTRLSVTDYAECAAICAGGTTVTGVLAVPAQWRPAAGLAEGTDQGNGTLAYPHAMVNAGPGAELVFQRSLPIDEIAVDTTLAQRGAVTQTITYWVTQANDADAQGGFARVLAPPQTSGGTYRSGPDGARVAYVVTFSADSVEQYRSRIADYLPGTTLTVTPRGNLLRADDAVVLTLDFSRILTDPATRGIGYRLTLPRLDTVRAAQSSLGRDPLVSGRTVSLIGVTPTASTLTVTAGGWTLGALVGGGVLALVLLAGAITLLARRGRSARSRAGRRTRPTAAAPAAGTPVLYVAAPSPGAPLATWTPPPGDEVTLPDPTSWDTPMPAVGDPGWAASPRPGVPPAPPGGARPPGVPPTTPATPSQPYSPYAPADVDFGPGAGLGSGLGR